MSVIPNWHFSMLNDNSRNEAFQRAIKGRVNPRHSVLDIGAGTGLLSIIADDAGARTVDAFEAHPAMAQVATQILDRHGSDSISLHKTHSTNIQFRPGERKNFLVTETVDCALIGEGLIPTLRHARRHLLTESYDAVPVQATLHGRLMSSPQVRSLNEASKAAGIDVSDINELQTQGHFPVRLDTWPHTFVSDEFGILTLSLLQDPPDEQTFTVHTTATHDAIVDGIVAWFDMDLGDGESITTRPGASSTHWMQAYIPFSAPTEVHAGGGVNVNLRVVDDVSLVAESVVKTAGDAQRTALEQSI
ncbi:hypothetical protein ACQBJO_14005 [Janibacter sp. G349]|uniref:hypothetical protein n=1 Tax=unclassified Janibacter TaxID=2649294 RepID=UPI003B81CC3C